MAVGRTTWMSAILGLLAAAVLVSAQAAERDIYPAPAQAAADLADALATATLAHKRVLLDFGGNWCTDCHVLDRYFHDAANAPIVEAYYTLVHVNVGRLTENLAMAERYQIPLRKGVPALAVLGEKGELLYSQRTGEFEAMHAMQSSAVTEFLLHWKPPSH